MKNREQQADTVDDLIDALESAREGSRPLDVQLAFRLGESDGRRGGMAARLPTKWNALGDFPDIARIMLDEGFSWQSVCDVLDCEAPAYTSSLDAALPGENIVFVIRSARRDQWGAIHRSADGEEILGWGATEALARRIAALKGWKAFAAMPGSQEADAFPSEIPQRDMDKASTEYHEPVINGGHQPARAGKSLEETFAEQEDRDWEILF